MKTKYFLFIIIGLLSISQLSYSQIYKWVDKNGKTQFSDKKPQTGTRTESIKLKINSIKNPTFSNNTLSTDKTGENDYASAKRVIMYSADWCGVCKKAKKYFNQQSIPYKEYNIDKSAKGRTDFKRLGGRGVPIILIGKQRMDGFGAAAFEKMYRS